MIRHACVVFCFSFQLCTEIELKIQPAVWMKIIETLKFRYEAKVFEKKNGEIWYGFLTLFLLENQVKRVNYRVLSVNNTL